MITYRVFFAGKSLEDRLSPSLRLPGQADAYNEWLNKDDGAINGKFEAPFKMKAVAPMVLHAFLRSFFSHKFPQTVAMLRGYSSMARRASDPGP